MGEDGCCGGGRLEGLAGVQQGTDGTYHGGHEVMYARRNIRYKVGRKRSTARNRGEREEGIMNGGRGIMRESMVKRNVNEKRGLRI